MERIPYNPPEIKQREIHPAGTFAAVCVDVIDLGMRVKSFQDNKSSAHTIALVFSTGKKSADGFALDLWQEFTFSLHKKANLRKMLEAWRGKGFSEEEMGISFDIVGECFGKPVLLSVIHKPSADGSRTYANIGGLMALPEGMPVPQSVYKRAPFWEERKFDYSTAYAEYQREIMRDLKKGAPEPETDEAPF